jgi:hypothetical protein
MLLSVLSALSVKIIPCDMAAEGSAAAWARAMLGAATSAARARERSLVMR